MADEATIDPPKATTAARRIQDAELIAMHEILTTLEDLGEPAATRVVEWVVKRYAPPATTNAGAGK